MRFKVEKDGVLLELLAGWFPEASRTTLRDMLQQGRVAVDDEIEKNARRKLLKGNRVEVGKRTTASNLTPEIALLFEDDDLLVVIKPAGLLTVAAKGEQDETVQRHLNAYMKSKRGSRVHLVHRLDRDTSGVMMFAKNFGTRELLKDTFAAHDIDRVYIAIVEGKPPAEQGTIRSYLLEDEKSLIVRSVKDPKAGKLAITHYRVLESGKRYTKLEVRLETGRKNQIRAQFSEAGFPIVGDGRYGAKSDPVNRLGLHAFLLGFKHPHTGKMMRFTAPIPGPLRKLELSGLPAKPKPKPGAKPKPKAGSRASRG